MFNCVYCCVYCIMLFTSKTFCNFSPLNGMTAIALIKNSTISSLALLKFKNMSDSVVMF